MHGIKIPQQDFALKRLGGLVREGGCICRTLRYVRTLRKYIPHSKPRTNALGIQCQNSIIVVNHHFSIAC